MLKTSHIIVANRTLNTVQSKLDWKVNKVAYLFGSIAPDFNYAFPTHCIDKTYTRFSKRLMRIDNANSILLKSYTLGLITHYICDYFCYAHNLNHTDPKHAIYERVMRHHIKEHGKLIPSTYDTLNNHWKDLQTHMLESMVEQSSIDEVIDNITTKGIDHIQYIMKLTSHMHKEYLELTKRTEANRWYLSTQKIDIDLDYAEFMCYKVISLLTKPESTEKYVRQLDMSDVATV